MKFNVMGHETEFRSYSERNAVNDMYARLLEGDLNAAADMMPILADGIYPTDATPADVDAAVANALRQSSDSLDDHLQELEDALGEDFRRRLYRAYIRASVLWELAQAGQFPESRVEPIAQQAQRSDDAPRRQVLQNRLKAAKAEAKQEDAGKRFLEELRFIFSRVSPDHAPPF